MRSSLQFNDKKQGGFSSTLFNCFDGLCVELLLRSVFLGIDRGLISRLAVNRPALASFLGGEGTVIGRGIERLAIIALRDLQVVCAVIAGGKTRHLNGVVAIGDGERGRERSTDAGLVGGANRDLGAIVQLPG